MGERVCDNKSVGIVLENDAQELLFIERRKFPFGFACVAGHIDDIVSPAEAAVTELYEEVGIDIKVDELELAIAGLRIHNQCRREGGDFHDWWVYRATVSSSEVIAEPSEVASHRWVERLWVVDELKKRSPQIEGLNIEGVWVDHLRSILDS